MKYCAFCGKELNDQSQFCAGCGAKCGVNSTEIIQPDREPVEATKAKEVCDKGFAAQSTTAPQPGPIPEEKPIYWAKVPQIEAPVSQAEPKYRERTNKEKKHKTISKGKIVLFSVLAVMLVLVITGGVLVFRWYTSTEQQVLRALDKGDYDAALEIVHKDGAASESSALADKLAERIANIKTGFTDGSIEYAAARMELETIGKMNVKGVSTDLQEVQAYVNSLNQSRIDFATAESFFATKDYAKAVEHYQLVIEQDANYETAVKKAAESINEYREEILAKASDYADAKLYSDAINLLNEALSTIPNDMKITERIRIYEKDNEEKLREDALTTAENYAKKGDYLHAFQTLATAIESQGSDAKLVSAHNKYRDQYVSNVISEVDGKVADKNFDGAISMLNSALKELPENKILKAKLDEVKAKKPLSIINLTEINRSGWEKWNSGNPTDPFGNDYTSASNYCIVDCYDGKDYIEYRLYGKYDTITGTIAPYTTMEEGDEGYFQIYVDDELVYTAPSIKRKTDAFTFSVDISGADYIKLYVCADGYGNRARVILSNVLVWP